MMIRIPRTPVLLLAMVLGHAQSSAAVQIFFDDFSGDPGVAYGQTSLVNWSVVQGNVDVLNPGFPGCPNFPGSACPGTSIDLDGSYVSDLTTMQTNTEFVFQAGLEYRLVLNIAGVNPDTSVPNASRYDGFRVTIGSLLSETFPNASYAVPLLIDRSFIPTAGEQARIVIELLDGRDFVGPLLDRVELHAVPEPSVALLVGVGLSLISCGRRPTPMRPLPVKWANKSR
jgi:hypothetical protein